MDFTFPEEITALRASFSDFVKRQIMPLEEELAGEFESLSPDRQRIVEAMDRVRALSVEAGFFAAHMPESVGGQGLSTLGMTALVEDAARSGSRLAMTAISPPNPAGPSSLLLKLPDHLIKEWVTPVVTGTKTVCFALTEPEAGSDAQAIRTKATKDGDGWRINGHKHYITNASHADFAVVFAVTDAQKRAAGGITAFLVPADQFRRGPTQWNISDTHPGELFFEDAWVPDDHVVGEVGLGFFAAMEFLNAGRAFIGAQALGLAQFSLDAATAHVQARTAFGKPLAAFQGASFPLAESKVEIEAMRWLVYHLAWAVDEGQNPMLDASIVKYYSTERAYAVADRCLQVFGGMGLMKSGPIERVLRHLRMLRVVEGASEIQLLVISRALTVK
ncbi:MAG: acyl-CoA/acyl-ACP dehydrogenase [Actinobacteria bacterium]|jgi:alkylation response protein AidB-like acyl-CoA dehydrogenase|nr:acyl-CoA/acyl-ACP dehydrogenase [Micrococcales bacterium]MCB0904002.1 acyl-CoA/acyl-ACP dehydrogenase [Actinomycetota bacterium]MCO5299515.1 acyl-CoA/acyl-ACP dehydrogenase [Candidatus Nanopelagicales bacterium]MCB9428108.1 acyl-CoA/acyl-ACP dehydrogenase [Actinomycetota bacterium]HPE12260.1 acyl-CoA dehydrogenase family protein [Actinomycetota bacterium]